MDLFTDIERARLLGAGWREDGPEHWYDRDGHRYTHAEAVRIQQDRDGRGAEAPA